MRGDGRFGAAQETKCLFIVVAQSLIFILLSHVESPTAKAERTGFEDELYVAHLKSGSTSTASSQRKSGSTARLSGSKASPNQASGQRFTVMAEAGQRPRLIDPQFRHALETMFHEMLVVLQAYAASLTAHELNAIKTMKRPIVPTKPLPAKRVTNKTNKGITKVQKVEKGKPARTLK